MILGGMLGCEKPSSILSLAMEEIFRSFPYVTQIYFYILDFYGEMLDNFSRNLNVTRGGNMCLVELLTTLRHLKQNNMFSLAICCI